MFFDCRLCLYMWIRRLRFSQSLFFLFFFFFNKISILFLYYQKTYKIQSISYFLTNFFFPLPSISEFGQLGKSDNHSAACPYPVQLFLKEAKGKEEEEGEVGRVISVKCGRWFTSVVTDVSDLSVEKLQQFER